MISNLKKICAVLAFTILGAATLSAQVSVPNTFTSGTSASASEVNANFQALVDAANVAPRSLVTGYVTPEGASDAIAARNVTVMRYSDGTNYYYQIWIFHPGGSSSQIDVGGNPTTFTHILQICFLTESTAGVFVSASCSRYGSNDPYSQLSRLNYWESFSYDSSAVETSNGARIATSTWMNSTSSAFNGGVPRIDIDTDISTGNVTRVFGRSRFFGKVVGSIQFNDLTFSDVMFYEEPGRDRVRFWAAGIGLIAVQNTSNSGGFFYSVIYHRVDGVTGGSLTGTPFATGGAFDGAWF